MRMPWKPTGSFRVSLAENRIDDTKPHPHWALATRAADLQIDSDHGNPTENETETTQAREFYGGPAINLNLIKYVQIGLPRRRHLSISVQ